MTFVSTLAKSALAKLALSAAAILAISASAGAQSPVKNDPTTGSVPGSEGPTTGPVGDDSGFVPRGSPCAANAGNCQELNGTNVTNPLTSDLIGGGFSVADNFQPSVTGNITAICFTGYYGPGSPIGTNVPAVGNEAFRITIWANNGTGLPAGTPVAQIFVGANASTTLGAVTYTGTLTRGSGLGTPSSLANATLYAWTASGLSIPVTTGTCYWMEIVAATNALDTNSRWRWANTTHATGSGSYVDNVTLQTANGAAATYASIFNGPDRAFCLTIGSESGVLAVPSCGVPAIPANNLCTSAITIAPPYTAPSGTNTYRSSATLTPYCGTNPVNAPTIWYKTVGNGTTFTASTCGAATNFDTVINVYCLSGSSICGTNNVNLLCVANNDIGPAACVGNGGVNADPSLVSWTATNGTTYYIAVFGNYGGPAPIGALDFQLTSDGIQAAPVTCVTDRCPLDLSTITGTQEAEVCASALADPCTNPAGTFTLGTWLKGAISAAAPASGVPGNARDIDYWEYNTATPLPDNTGSAGQTALTVTWQAEAPIVLGFYTGACSLTNPTSVAIFVARYRPSLDGVASNGACGALTTDITTNAAAGFRVLVTCPDYGGIPCTSGWNNYAVKLDLAATGACCITGVACTVTTSGQCTASGGTFGGASVTCASAPCPGACCTNGACTAALTAASCTSGGGLYQGEGSTCAVTSCPQPTGICCRGATCNTLLPQANCTVTGSHAGVAFPVGPNCSGATITGCCFADYNKVNGIEVQDIFDFLNDWLAGSPFANTGGSGSGGSLAVQNIFDFLNHWFGGCTP